MSERIFYMTPEQKKAFLEMVKGQDIKYGAFPYQKAKPATDTHPVPPLTQGEKDER
jgi:hypothetical protein